MAFKSGFFNSVYGDRQYYAEDWAMYFSKFVGDGVFIDPANGLMSLENSGMTINITPGDCFIKGYYFVNTADYSLSVTPAHASLNRIDRVVARLDMKVRSIHY